MSDTALNKLFEKIRIAVKEYEKMNPTIDEVEEAKKIIHDICQEDYKGYPYINAIENYTTALISEVRGQKT